MMNVAEASISRGQPGETLGSLRWPPTILVVTVGSLALFLANPDAKANPAGQGDTHPTTVWAREYGIVFDSRYRPVDLPKSTNAFAPAPPVYAGQELLFIPAAMVYGNEMIDRLVLTFTTSEKNGLRPVANPMVDSARSELPVTCDAYRNETVTCTWKNVNPIAKNAPSHRGWNDGTRDLIKKINLEDFTKDPVKVINTGRRTLGYVAPFALEVTDNRCTGSVGGKVKVGAYGRNVRGQFTSEEKEFSVDLDIAKTTLQKGDVIRCVHGGKLLEYRYDAHSGKRVRELKKV